MAEIQQGQFQKRNVAYKVSIADILNGMFVKDEFSAGYIKLEDNNIHRVNVVATVVLKSEQGTNPNMIIDDGTGKVLLRSFENNSIFLKVDVGDFVLLIGKVREFNNERYIIPEILKKISNVEWINVRKSEIKIHNYTNQNTKPAITETAHESLQGQHDWVYSLIRELDTGEGAFFDDIIKKSSDAKAENIINILLERGDIFEISPGRLKVLE